MLKSSRQTVAKVVIHALLGVRELKSYFQWVQLMIKSSY